MAQPEISQEQDTLTWLRNKINTLRSEVESMKSNGISDIEKDLLKKNILQLKDEVQSQIGDNPHELYGELLETIDEIKKHRTKKESRESQENEWQLPEKIEEALKTIENTQDASVIEISQELREACKKMSVRERKILTECTPKIQVLDTKERELIKKQYSLTWKPGYYVFVDKNNAIQKAYIVSPLWLPLLSFQVSTGRSGRTTPSYNGTLRKPWNRTFLFQKIGQAYKHQAQNGMIDWTSSHAQMTTAVLALNTNSCHYLHGTNKEHNLGTPDSGWCIRFDNVSIAFLSLLYEKNPDNFYLTITDSGK